MFKRILIGATVLVSSVFLMGAGYFWGYPIINGPSYCASSVNGVCVTTIPAGPAVTGNELVPADTQAPNGQNPQSAYLSMADLNALPIQVVVVTTPPAGISASNISGGILYTSTTTITAANITLPAGPINQQRYKIMSNRTITTLSVQAGAGSGMGGNTAPTVLTASTTAPQNYEFMYNLADTNWYRVQ